MVTPVAPAPDSPSQASPAPEHPVQAAPPVIAVMVVHEPGDWFSESLASVAAQDYPNLRLVALLTGTTEPVVGEIGRAHV